MIEASKLCKRYGEIEAARGVSFTAAPGSVTGLLGPNGAGKTTVMRILAGYLLADSGSASIAGIDVASDPIGAKRALGYLPESAPLYGELSVREFLAFMSDARMIGGKAKRAAIERVAESCAVSDVLSRRIDELSKGYRQRVALAQAIIHDPEVLILDEPTSGLDPNQIIEIRDLISRLAAEKTVLLSTHALGEAEALCGNVLIMSAGRIVAEGPPGSFSPSGRAIVRVALRGHIARDTSERLAALPGVLSATVLGMGENAADEGPAARGSLKAELSLSAASDDFAARLQSWATESSLVVTEYSPRRDSLEETFVRVTSEGGHE
jgi:ABC-2 type transport system ATP-binding protein